MPPPQLISYYQPPAASTGAVSSLHSQLTALQPAVSAGALTAGAFAGLQPQFTAQQPVVTVGVTHCPHTHFTPPHPAALTGAVSAPPGWQPQVTAPQLAVTAGAAHSLSQLFTIQPAITAVSPSVLLSTQQPHTSQLAIPGSHTFHLAPLNTSIPPLPTRFATAAAVGEFVDFNELLYCIELGSGEEPRVRAQLGEDQQLALSRKPKKCSFEEWVKCFTVYSNNLCAHNPSRGPDMLGYLFVIANSLQEFSLPAVLAYNVAFRRKAALLKLATWGQIDPLLYSRAFTGPGKAMANATCPLCLGLGHSAADCSFYLGGPAKTAWGATAGPRQSAPTYREICIRFNRGRCLRNDCPRRHICSVKGCGGPHASLCCPGKRSSPRKQ